MEKNVKKGKKVTVLGAGNVGASIAFALAIKGLCSELLLVDINKPKAKGEAIRTNKLASDLYVAEQNFNNFVNSVFNIITATLTGEEPEQGGGCDPSCCSSCGGGCH